MAAPHGLGLLGLLGQLGLLGLLGLIGLLTWLQVRRSGWSPGRPGPS